MAYSKEEYTLCAAIDIGTAFSSYVYSYKGADKEKELAYRKDWGANLGIIEVKAPTAVLVDKDGKFVNFGYEAHDIYKKMDEQKAKDFALFENFKLGLYSKVSVEVVYI